MRAFLFITLFTACNDNNLAVYNTPPSVSIVSPEAETLFAAGDVVEFYGVAQDSQDDSGELLITWYSDLDGDLGGTPPDGSGDTFLTTANLSEGVHAITFSAFDTSGESDTAATSIVIGGIPGEAPQVTLINPDEGESLYFGGPINFFANVIDPDQAAETLSLSILSDEDGTVWTGNADSDGDVEVELYDLSAGGVTLTLRATDTDGNIGQAAVTIDTFDDGRPQAAIDTPLTGETVFNDRPVPLSGAVSDDLTDVELIGVLWESDVDGVLFEGFPDSEGITSFSYPLSSGFHTITLTATDQDDNTGSRSIAIEVINPLDIDDDGDGFTENQGDCDDLLPEVNPNEVERCDELDNNCDGQINETWADAYESNETQSTYHNLGDIGGANISPVTLHHPGDVDWFRWKTENSILNSGDVDLDTGSLPVSNLYTVTLYRRSGGGWTFIDSTTGGGVLSLNYAADFEFAGSEEYLIEFSTSTWDPSYCDEVYVIRLQD